MASSHCSNEYLSQSTGDEIPGIDAMLHLLSLYSSLGAREKKNTTYTRSKGPKCQPLWASRPHLLNGQGGTTTRSDMVDSSRLNPAKLSGVPLQRARGCLSAAPGSAAEELKLCQGSRTPSSLQRPLFSRIGTMVPVPCKDESTHLSCSPVISTSASRSSSAAFFCMVFPIPSMSVLTHDAHDKDIILQRAERARVAVSVYMLKKKQPV